MTKEIPGRYCVKCKRRRRPNHQSSRGYCKKCSADYQREYRKKNKARIAEKDKARYNRTKALIREAKNKPCADCKRQYPYWIMDFDHRPGEGKITEVSKMVTQGCSEKRILAEIAKCDIVCANCHRDRTHRRQQENL